MGKIKGWKKGEFWTPNQKGGDWLFYHLDSELGSVHYNYFHIGKVESEDSPYFSMWFIEWHTGNKQGKNYFSSRKKAVNYAMKYMRSHPNG